MTAKKRARARKALPPMPLSELPMMKALIAMATPAAGSKTARKPATTEDPKIQLKTLTLTIIDKLQVLMLRRPRALIIVAQVLDRLLDEQLAVLDENPDARKHRTPPDND
jgi:hypothetical protein